MLEFDLNTTSHNKHSKPSVFNAEYVLASFLLDSKVVVSCLMDNIISDLFYFYFIYFFFRQKKKKKKKK